MFGPAKAAKQRNENENRKNDKYYTKQTVSNQCVDDLVRVLDISKVNVFFEPSVGQGAFVDSLIQHPSQFNKKYIIANDIDKYENDEVQVMQKDFLTIDPTTVIKNSDLLKTNNTVVFGNPPFGKNASTAVKFFHHAATFAQAIAFIVPRSFRKASVINRLDRNFHLVFERILEKNCFEYEGKPVNVPCVWCVWVHKDHTDILQTPVTFAGKMRNIIEVGPSESNIVSFSKDHQNASLMIQRVGEAAGRVTWDKDKIIEKSPSRNFYYIVLDPQYLEHLKGFDMSSYEGKYDTAGMPSITKPDVVHEIHSYLGKH